MAAVPNAIFAATNDTDVMASMLLGSNLEGGWNPPYPPGDSGTSFGPYQLHEGGLLTSLGLTRKQAENAKTATAAMLPIYQKAASGIPSSLWQSDPEKAAEQTAVAAERPAQDYFTSRGQGTVDSAWNATMQQMGTPATFTSAGGGILNTILGAIGASLGLPSLGSFNLKSDLERIGLVIFGGLLILAGLIVFAIPAGKAAAETAIGATATGRSLGLLNKPGSEERTADRARRAEIAERSLALGERKQTMKESRESRLAQMSRAKLNRGVG